MNSVLDDEQKMKIRLELVKKRFILEGEIFDVSSMNREWIREHAPSFVVGFLGALVCQVIVATIVVGVLIASPLRMEAYTQFRSMIDRVVRERTVVDSSGQHSDVVSVVDLANPAVVSIVISKDVPKMEQFLNEGSQKNPFGIFGLNIPQYRQNGTEEKEIGGGSGFIVSEDGYIVTNAHVVSDKEAKYTVLLNNDESKHDATVVAADETLDIAVLKIEGNDLPFLEFGDSDAVKVGQSVVAIGNALGQFRNTVSVGVISGLSRSITAGDRSGSEVLPDVLQTDAAINPGNSGGPLLDLAGKVIGVNVATSSGGESISFALPSNMVRVTVDGIRENGRVIQAYLGVRYVTIDEAYAKANDLSVNTGALVRRGDDGKTLAVVPGSPADKAGIEENDIILAVDDVLLDEKHPLYVVLRQKAVGDTVTLKVLHDGREQLVSVTLAERPTSSEKE